MALQSDFHIDIELETSITSTVCVRIHTYTIVDYTKTQTQTTAPRMGGTFRDSIAYKVNLLCHIRISLKL